MKSLMTFLISSIICVPLTMIQLSNIDNTKSDQMDRSMSWIYGIGCLTVPFIVTKLLSEEK